MLEFSAGVVKLDLPTCSCRFSAEFGAALCTVAKRATNGGQARSEVLVPLCSERVSSSLWFHFHPLLIFWMTMHILLDIFFSFSVNGKYFHTVDT